MRDAVLQFWFEELDSKQWWLSDPELDQTIADRFGDLHTQACAGELDDWRESTKGRLAEIIVLDQFSRNIFRDSPRAFAQDGMAVVLTQMAVESGALDELNGDECGFLLMPLMHSESREIHRRATDLFKRHASDNNYQFEVKHKDIIDRFGRYPHRNEILGRESTSDELEFLKQPGSSF